MNNKPFKKFSIFSLGLSLTLLVIGITWYVVSITSYPDGGWAIIGLSVFFGYPSLGLFVISIISILIHLFYKKDVVPRLLMIFGVTISILIFVSPAILLAIQHEVQQKIDSENQARWAQENTPEKLRTEQERLADENMKANCALFEKSIATWKDGEPKPLKPTECP